MFLLMFEIIPFLFHTKQNGLRICSLFSIQQTFVAYGLKLNLMMKKTCNFT